MNNLRKAAQFFRDNPLAWIQNGYAAKADGKRVAHLHELAVKWDIVGRLGYEGKHGVVWTEKIAKEMDCLREVIGSSATVWQDRAKRKVTEVVEALEKAADLWENLHGQKGNKLAPVRNEEDEEAMGQNEEATVAH